jgi:glycosyltransferase involved in cell wall biosynthesis
MRSSRLISNLGSGTFTNMNKIKVARVVTVPITFLHILNLLDFLSNDERFELHIICARDYYLEEFKSRYPKITFHIIEIPREISIVQDLKALIQLTFLYFREDFDIVHSHTPKAGVVSAMAAFITRTPVRIHTFTGQVWTTLTGAKRFLLVSLDRLIGLLNTHNYADSLGQRNMLLRHKVGKEKTLTVLHHGSFGGINTVRFNRDRVDDKIKALHSELFPDFNGKILIYLGRLNQEKGLQELSDAFFELKKKHPLKLLLVGPQESDDNEVFLKLINNLKADKDVVYINFTSTPEYYLGVADIFCFPSYREGFGTVALEAAAMGIPVVASNIYGLSDAVSDGKTGLLFEPRNAKDLALKLERLIVDTELARKLGAQGRERVIQDFAEQILTQKMVDEYLRFIKFS